MTITKDSIIGDILDAYGEVTAPFFLEMGMHCLGCPASRGETDARADTLAKTCGGGRNGA